MAFKSKAISHWEQLNCHNELIQCQKELKDLQSNNKSEYLLRLKKIRVFTDGLLKLEQPAPMPNRQTLIKWNLPILIQ
jgi:hypothetical protein